jgi:mannose-6-phosphate isomerase-like protein (cupin superfamily)
MRVEEKIARVLGTQIGGDGGQQRRPKNMLKKALYFLPRLFKAKYIKRTGGPGHYEYEYEEDKKPTVKKGVAFRQTPKYKDGCFKAWWHPDEKKITEFSPNQNHRDHKDQKTADTGGFARVYVSKTTISIEMHKWDNKEVLQLRNYIASNLTKEQALGVMDVVIATDDEADEKSYTPADFFGVKKMAKALHFLRPRTARAKIEPSRQHEQSPWQAHRDYEAMVVKVVSDRLLELFLAIRRQWLHLPGEFRKASGEELFRLNGRIFISPKTGRPLTAKQWKEVMQSLDAGLRAMFRDQPDILVKRAMLLGKVLQGMDYESRRTARLSDVRPVGGLPDNPAWRYAERLSRQNAAALLVGLQDDARKGISTTIVRAIRDKKTPRQLELDLFDKFADLNRDWRRIAETEIAENLTSGLLLAEEDTREKDETIYMIGISAPGACKECERLIQGKVVVLLKEPNSGKIKVKGEEYDTIWPGKSNVGRKAGAYWPCVPLHPHCRCSWTRFYLEMRELLGIGKSMHDLDEVLMKAKYIKRWRGKNGKWQYLYKRPVVKQTLKKEGDIKYFESFVTLDKKNVLKYLQERKVPKNWFISGRGEHRAEDSGILQATNRWEIGEQYSRGGYMIVFTPKSDSNVMNMMDVKVRKKIVEDLIQDFEEGNLDYDLDQDCKMWFENVKDDEERENNIKSLEDGFLPKNIVDSAENYDNPALYSWLYDKYRLDMAYLGEDAAVGFEKENLNYVEISGDDLEKSIHFLSLIRNGSIVKLLRKAKSVHYGFHVDVEKATEENRNYRKVIFTGPHAQLVLMSLPPGGDIGAEVHEGLDQFFRVESGSGRAVLGGHTYSLKSGDAVVVPAGTRHNVIAGRRGIKLYTVYTSKQHPDGIVEATKAEAEEREGEESEVSKSVRFVFPVRLTKAKYLKRWRGKDGRWQYLYRRPIGKQRNKESSKLENKANSNSKYGGLAGPKLSPERISSIAQYCDGSEPYTEGIIEEMDKAGVDMIDAYHVASIDDVDSINKDGIKTADWYHNQSGVYFFADPDDLNDAYPYLNVKDDVGDVGGKLAVVHFKIPKKDVGKLKWDSFFNVSFGTYSAFLYKGKINSNQIIDHGIIDVASREKQAQTGKGISWNKKV